MKIKILGTRGEIKLSAPYHSRHSAILIDNKIMMDLGEKIFLRERPKYIFITHLHPDHAFFTANGFQKIKIPIFAPEKSKGTSIKIFKKKRNFDSYKITPIPTIHSKLVKSQAYLIEKGDKKILYTGDMVWINKKYHPLLKNLNLVITEGSFIKKGGMVRKDKFGAVWGHAGAPDLIRFFKKFTKYIVFVHFGSWFFKDTAGARKKIKKIGKENNIQAGVSYDNMEFVI